MRALVRLTILGGLIQSAGMLSFIGIAKTAFHVPGKQIVIIIFLIAMIFLLSRAVTELYLGELLLLSLFLTGLFVCIHELLAFCVFPGLAKDIMPFSLLHMRLLAEEVTLLFLGYMSVILGIWAMRKLLKV